MPPPAPTLPTDRAPGLPEIETNLCSRLRAREVHLGASQKGKQLNSGTVRSAGSLALAFF